MRMNNSWLQRFASLKLGHVPIHKVVTTSWDAHHEGNPRDDGFNRWGERTLDRSH